MPTTHPRDIQDSESGLYYLRARYYSPSTAQFLSVDPVVAATKAPYSYAAGDPLSFSDRSGLDSGLPSGYSGPSATCIHYDNAGGHITGTSTTTIPLGSGELSGAGCSRVYGSNNLGVYEPPPPGGVSSGSSGPDMANPGDCFEACGMPNPGFGNGAIGPILGAVIGYLADCVPYALAGAASTAVFGGEGGPAALAACLAHKAGDIPTDIIGESAFYNASCDGVMARRI